MRDLSHKDATKMGEKGGRNRAQALSPDARKEIAKAGAAERWKRWREKRTAAEREGSNPPNPA
jgi:hypothetical protein